MVDQEKLSRWEVVHNVNKDVHPIGLLAPTALKHKSLLQMWTKGGLEEKLLASPEKPNTGDPELKEFPDKGVLVELESWRRKLGSFSAGYITMISWSSSRGSTLAHAHHLLKSYSNISRSSLHPPRSRPCPLRSCPHFSRRF